MKFELTRETIPNYLTISRVALIPVLVGFLYFPFHFTSWVALILYAAICITDYLDGYLARKWQVSSPIGTFLDPIADKILVAVLLIVLVDLGRLPGIWILPVAIIFVREFLIAGLREHMGAKNINVPVIFIAKWKTAIQMIAMGFLIIGHLNDMFLYIGWAGILIAAAITAYTGYIYMKSAWEHLVAKNDQGNTILRDDDV